MEQKNKGRKKRDADIKRIEGWEILLANAEKVEGKREGIQCILKCISGGEEEHCSYGNVTPRHNYDRDNDQTHLF